MPEKGESSGESEFRAGENEAANLGHEVGAQTGETDEGRDQMTANHMDRYITDAQASERLAGKFEASLEKAREESTLLDRLGLTKAGRQRKQEIAKLGSELQKQRNRAAAKREQAPRAADAAAAIYDEEQELAGEPRQAEAGSKHRVDDPEKARAMAEAAASALSRASLLHATEKSLNEEARVAEAIGDEDEASILRNAAQMERYESRLDTLRGDEAAWKAGRKYDAESGVLPDVVVQPEQIRRAPTQFDTAQREAEAVLRARESGYEDVRTTGDENDLSILEARLNSNLMILRQHAETEEQHAVLRNIESRLK